MKAPGTRRGPKRAVWTGRLLLLLASTLLCLAFLEGALRLLTPFPITQGSNRRLHPRLGYVVDSWLPDVDEDGFRNRGVTLADAEIVVVGDSHTYGYNVESEQSFPSVLSRLTGRPVYNMGIGSYGIYQYFVLFDDLASVPARHVIVALHPGNDLMYQCAVTHLPSWQEFAGSLGIRAQECGDFKGINTQHAWLKQRVALLSAIDNLIVERLKPDRDEPAFRFPEGQGVAVKKVEAWAYGTSFETDGVRLGYENSLRILEWGRDRLEAKGTTLSVLFIPTRGRVLLEWAHRHGHPIPERFAALMAHEDVLMRGYTEFLRERGIAYVDALPWIVAALESAVDREEHFYPNLRDEHPLESGYEAYAEAAAELLAGAQDGAAS